MSPGARFFCLAGMLLGGLALDMAASHVRDGAGWAVRRR
jgi:hypothetical protein